MLTASTLHALTQPAMPHLCYSRQAHDRTSLFLVTLLHIRRVYLLLRTHLLLELNCSDLRTDTSQRRALLRNTTTSRLVFCVRAIVSIGPVTIGSNTLGIGLFIVAM